LRHDSPSDAELFGDGDNAPPFSNLGSGVDNLLGRQDGVGRALSAGKVSAALGHHVSPIVPLRSQEQVGRIDARWVVAAVADDHPGRDRPVRKLKRESVCSHLNVRVSRLDHEGPVTSRVPRGGPFPAFVVGFPINVFPEANNGVFGLGHETDHITAGEV
jgi:hypothetical protein